jgi:hypothetical protein
MHHVRLLLFLAISLLVAGCSTTVNTRQALQPTAVGTLKYEQIDIVRGNAAITDGVVQRLKTSVDARLSKLPQGNLPVKLVLTIVDFSVESEGTRIFAGALAGSNTMTVAVKVTDGMGAIVADFDVVRASNPGGYGAFYDQRAATVDSVADGIVEVMSGMK